MGEVASFREWLGAIKKMAKQVRSARHVSQHQYHFARAHIASAIRASLAEQDFSGIQKIKSASEPILRGAARDHGSDFASWLRGYQAVHARDYASARPHYIRAMRSFNADAEFLMDYGRLEYNTGRLAEALEHFVNASQLPSGRDALTPYRFMAKVFRLLGRYNDEADALEELKAKALQTHDQTSLIFANERLPRALIDSGRVDEAAELAGRLYDGTTEVSFVELQVEALCRAGRYSEAEEVATKVALEPGRLSVSVAYLRYSNRRFSSRRMLVKEVIAEAARHEELEEYLFPDRARGIAEVESVPGAFTALYQAATGSFRYGFFENGLEMALAAADYAFRHNAPLSLSTLLGLVNENLHGLPHSTQLADLFEEAAQAFPSVASPWFQLGHFRRMRGEFRAAVRAYERASESTDDEVLGGFYLLLAQAVEDPTSAQPEAIAALLTRASAPDSVILFKEACAWAFDSGRYVPALEWGRMALSDKFMGITQINGAHEIFELAGQAAMQLQDYATASEFFEYAAVSLAGRFDETRAQVAAASIERHSRLNAMWALSSALLGNLESARSRADIAVQQSPANPFVTAVEAIVAVDDGRSREAAAIVLNADLDQRLAAIVGQYVLDASSSQHASAPELGKLRSRIAVISGGAQSHEDLYAHASSIEEELHEAREEAQASRRSLEATLGTMERIVKQLPLDAGDVDFRSEMVDALKRGEKPHVVLLQWEHRILEHFQADSADRVRLYQDNLGDATFRLLPREVKGRLDAAQNYAALAADRGLDFGPGYLALASALEHVLKLGVLEPLRRAFRDRGGLDGPVPSVVTSKKVESFTLGAAAAALPGAGVVLAADYEALVETALNSHLGPAGFRAFNDHVAPRLTYVSRIRNDWAHGTLSVQEADFRNLETALVFSPSSAFLEAVADAC